MSKSKPNDIQDEEAEKDDSRPRNILSENDSDPSLPKQAPPLPHIFFAIYELKKDGLEGPFRRIAEDIQSLIDKSGLADKYNFVFLYDENSSISERTSNEIYAAASGDFADKNKPHYLLLHTRGGSAVPAYLISRYLKTSVKNGFVAVVPRLAKSAGTLIALGAQQIHMGMMSELGPVDPQISDMPALGLGSALDYIAGVCEKHPGASEMLARYLQANLNIHHLGLFERLSESAAQYAEKLLVRNTIKTEKASAIAKRLVYGDKDHSFAIDCDEIRGILEDAGDEIVRVEAEEYELANQIHQYMEQVNFAYRVFHRKYCAITGRVDRLSLNDLDD